MKRRVLWLTTALALAVAVMLAAPVLRAGGETINYSDINKIKAEGLQRSQVMELCSWLSDVYTPRVTGSPTALKAAEWAVAKMKAWGLSNVAIEPWGNRNGFDRGWTNDKFYMQVTAPERFPVPGTPTAWTPGTNGLVSGEAVLVTATTDGEDLAQYKGKLKGKWVLVVAAPDVAAFWDARAKRFKAEDLSAMELQPAPAALEFGVTPPWAARGGSRRAPGRAGAAGRPRRRGTRPARGRSGSRRPGRPARRAGARGDTGHTDAAAVRRRRERPRRFPSRRRRARHHHDERHRPRDLHHRRQPQRRPRDDAPGRLHRGRAVRPHRPDAGEEHPGDDRGRHQEHLSSQSRGVQRGWRFPRCSTWSARSPARTRPTRSCCSAPTSTPGTRRPARPTTASVSRP